MPALRLPSTTGTRPHLDVKAADDGRPHDVFLVLRLGAVQDERTLTVLAERVSGPLENGAALRLLARSASSSCLRRRSLSASARSNCFSNDATRRSSSLSGYEQSSRWGACIHLTMTQTGGLVQSPVSMCCVY